MRSCFIIMPLSLIIFLFSGCKRSVDENDKSQKVILPGVSFKEGRGLDFLEETRKAIGLQTTEVSSKDIVHTINTSAQVYRESGERLPLSTWMRPGCAYASALVSSAEAKVLKTDATVDLSSQKNGEVGLTRGRIGRMNHQTESATGQVELLIEIPDFQGILKMGHFLNAQVTLVDPRQDLTVPSSAVVKTTSGTFVYVKNGEYFFRTEVQIGAEGKGAIQIRDGLYEGDTVVSVPAEKLWLIELRAVKGGGHSH